MRSHTTLTHKPVKATAAARVRRQYYCSMQSLIRSATLQPWTTAEINVREQPLQLSAARIFPDVMRVKLNVRGRINCVSFSSVVGAPLFGLRSHQGCSRSFYTTCANMSVTSKQSFVPSHGLENSLFTERNFKITPTVWICTVYWIWPMTDSNNMLKNKELPAIKRFYKNTGEPGSLNENLQHEGIKW